MDENNENNDLENLIIKDKNYYRKRRKKIFLISIPIILVIAFVILLIFVIISIPEKPKKIYNEIICTYTTWKQNENITLININNDIDFNLIINNINYGKNNSFIFEEIGYHKVTFEFKNKLNSLDGIFKENENLYRADFSKLQLDKIVSMANLFKSCIKLKNVYFDNETPNLEDLSNMFYNCERLDIATLNFNTSKVIKMDFMFYGCSYLFNLYLSNFRLENVSNAASMFQGCTYMRKIYFNENTSLENLEDMNSMFYGCKSLKYIDTKIFKVNKITNLSYAFAGCSDLIELDLTNFIVKNVKELSGTFWGCYNIKK